MFSSGGPLTVTLDIFCTFFAFFEILLCALTTIDVILFFSLVSGGQLTPTIALFSILTFFVLFCGGSRLPLIYGDL